MQDIIDIYKNHESISQIKQNNDNSQQFMFSHISEHTVCSKLKKMNPRKATGYDQIPSKLLKIAAAPLSRCLTPIFNSSIATSVFPNSLKNADVSPVYKKADNLIKENFRPISVLTSTSKIFEGIVSDQLIEFFKSRLSQFLAAYRPLYSCNNVLLCFIEYLRKALDDKKYAACILMDLSKAFDCLPHDLLLAKLNAYGVSIGACDFLRSYLSQRKQRVKIQNSYSNWREITVGVPQGSILGPLLFNIFINDLFYVLDSEIKLFNYADDNTLVYSHIDKYILKSKLEQASIDAITWFDQNGMKANPDKFQSLLINRNATDHATFILDNNTEITPDSSAKLLGITFDEKLNFDMHVDTICKKAAKQLNALKRLSKHLSVKSKLTIYNSYIFSNLNYCPIVYSSCSMTSFKRIEKIQERALRFVYNDYISPYKHILEIASKPSVALLHIMSTLEQVYKVTHNLAPPLPTEFFTVHESHYSLRDTNRLYLPQFKTVKYGKKSFRYRGSYLWNLLPLHIKNSISINVFKEQLKKWDGPYCNCQTCHFCKCSLS